MNEIIALCAIITLAGFFQGITGFGSMLVAIPLLSLFMDIKTVIPVLLIFGLIMNMNIAWTLRTHIRWKRTLLLLAGTLPGIPFGIWMLEHGNTSWLQLIVAAVLLGFSLQGLLFKGFRNPPGRTWAPIAGFGCGFLTAAISAGGPPVIVYATSQSWPKDEIKALMAGYFLITSSFVNIGYAYRGLITTDTLIMAAIGMPTMLLAIFFGQKVYARLSGKDYKQLTLLLLAMLGIMMLFRGLV